MSQVLLGGAPHHVDASGEEVSVMPKGTECCEDEAQCCGTGCC